MLVMQNFKYNLFFDKRLCDLVLYEYFWTYPVDYNVYIYMDHS